MKNRKVLIFLFSANSVSAFAQGITMISIPWILVNEMGEAGGKLLNASMVAIVTLISLFWGVYAGTLIDRYNRKRIFQGLNGVDFFILGGVALYGFQTGAVPFILMALVFATTMWTYNLHFPNLYAFVQELFEPRYYAKVNSAIELQHQVVQVFGMIAAGILLTGTSEFDWWPEGWVFEKWELHQIFLLDASTYFIAFILISMIPYKPSPNRRVDKGSVFNRIQMGFEYLWNRKPLLVFGISSYLVFFSILIIIQIALPIYVSDYLQGSAAVLTSFEAFYSLGAIVSGLVGLSALVRKTSIIRQVIFLLLLASACYFVAAVTHSVAITLVVAILIGVSNAGTRILRITYIVSVVPTHVIGRVNSFFNVVNVSMRFLFISMLAIPFFSAPENGGNIIYVFLMLSVIVFLGALSLVIRFRTFEDKKVEG